MALWQRQLLAHRDEATERFGLDANALPKISAAIGAQLLGWYRQERGPVLDKKWWRASMSGVLRIAAKDGWSAKLPASINDEVWKALAKVARDLDRLAPDGNMSTSDALELSGARKVPGMIAELKGSGLVPKKIPVLPGSEPDKSTPEAAALLPPEKLKPPKIPVDKVPRPRLPRAPKLGKGFALLLILVAVATSNRK